jgi:hypothetical protein
MLLPQAPPPGQPLAQGWEQARGQAPALALAQALQLVQQ